MNTNLPKKSEAGYARIRAKRAVRRYGDHTAPPSLRPRRRPERSEPKPSAIDSFVAEQTEELS